MPLHILYIPGLGDTYDIFRRFCLRFWRIFGVTAELVPMHWSDGASFQQKVAAVTRAIDHAKGKRIVLLGESAGGSMVLNIYASRPNDLYKVMTICGKNTGASQVAPHLYAKNPAFKMSMYAAEKSLLLLSKQQRQAFISIYPLADRVVPVSQTLIPHCQRVRLWTVGHVATIAFTLTAGSFIVTRLAKK